MKTPARLLLDLGSEPTKAHGKVSADNLKAARDYHAEIEAGRFDLLSKAYELQKDSFFFTKVPGEIRNKIYECLLVTDQVVDSDRYRLNSDLQIKRYGPRYGKGFGLGPAILRSCRAVFCEAFPFLYERNTFAFTEEAEMKNVRYNYYTWGRGNQPLLFAAGSFLVLDSFQRFACIRRVALRMRIEYYFSLVDLYTSARSLKVCLKSLNLLPAIEHLVVDLTGADDRWLAGKALEEMRVVFESAAELGGGAALKKVEFKGLKGGDPARWKRKLEGTLGPSIEVVAGL